MFHLEARNKKRSGWMLEKTYQYSLFYKLNFVPGLLFILFFLILVVISSSTTKIYGYVFLSCLLIYFGALFFVERKRVARRITISNEGITAKRFLSDDIFIKWSDIKSLGYAGHGLFLVSGKIEKYLYCEIVASDKRKIIFRREIKGYPELIQSIENNAGEKFKASSA
jgi:hypothetical protein